MPVPPSGGSFRRWCYKLATNDYFDYFILFLVCINVIEMCVWWYGIDDGTLAMKENVNLVLSALFGVRSMPFSQYHLFLSLVLRASGSEELCRWSVS